jgi:hypothetical protein
VTVPRPKGLDLDLVDRIASYRSLIWTLSLSHPTVLT